MSDILHGRAIKPRLYPNKGGSPLDLDRVDTRSAGVSQGSEDKYELGRRNKCGTIKETPESQYSWTSQETGTNDVLLTLTNLDTEPVTGFELSDFESALTDIIDVEKVDFGEALEKILWLPKLAINSIELSITDAEGTIETSFELIGDDHRELQYNNNYFIYVNDVAPSATSGNYNIVVNDPAPVEDPNNSGVFIMRLDRIRAGVTTTLELTTDYTFDDPSDTITVISALTDDEYRVYYTASSWGSAGDPTSLNNTDPCFLKAENVTVSMFDGTTTVELDILDSLTISASPTREDKQFIGSASRDLREVASWETSIALSGSVKGATVSEVLQGVAGTNHGIIDVDEFLENSTMTVKIYSDSTKTTFLKGYKVNSLVFSDKTEDATSNEFGQESINLTSDNLLITTDEGNL